MIKNFRTPCLLLTLLLASVVQVSAKKLEEQIWHEVKSENFNIYSTLSVEEASGLLHNLEILRRAIPATTNIQTTESPIPTTIISVKKATELRKFGLNNGITGVYVAGLRRNLILIRNSKFADSNHTILHEYVHYLTRNGSAQNYPRWYSEGFAEYFATATLNEDVFEIGRFPKNRLRRFRNCDWVAVKWVILNSRRAGCMFYPESWAMVHYIQTLPDHAKMMSDYLQRVEEGEDNIDSFVAAFGTDITTFNSRVRLYVKKGNFSYIGINANALLDDFQVSNRPVLRDEISLILGQAALKLNSHKSARRWFDIAATNESFRAQAESGIGDIYRANDQFDEAEPYFSSALSLEPNNVSVLLDMGTYWLSRARKEEDSPVRNEYLRTARKYFGKAWKLDENLPEIYTKYGKSFLMQQEFEKSIDTLTAAHRLLPSAMVVRLNLAEAYVGVGNMDDARAHAQAVKIWSHEESEAHEKAKKFLNKIDPPLKGTKKD